MNCWTCCLALLTALPLYAAPPIAGSSFEKEADLLHFKGSGFSPVESRAQFGSKSLEWKYGANEVIEVSNIRSLSPEESGLTYGTHFPLSPSFVMSLYNEVPQDGSLRVEFDQQTWFDLNLNFKGWRTVWVPYHEMQGRVPEQGASWSVQTVRFIAPASDGTLWFDDIVFDQYLDDRHAYPGLEVPFVKEGGRHSWDHWMPKIPHWKMLCALEVPEISEQQAADLAKVEERLEAVYFNPGKHVRDAAYYREQFAEEGVFPEEGLPLPLRQDKQLAPVRYELALDGEPDYVEMRSFGMLMLKLAKDYRSATDDGSVRQELGDLFASASEYYLDQGWAAGSSQGTIHHIGYSTRELQTAFFLMRTALQERGLLAAIGDAVRWQLNFGEMLDPDHLESNLDYYNTQSAFRLMSVFLAPDPAQQSILLKTYSDHLGAALALTGSQGFRPDGTAWHHWGHYPAYATGAFDRVPVSLEVLSGTVYRVAEAGHANFRRAFLSATIYSNPLYWGLGQAGRHPLGGNINKLRNSCLSLALSGTPDGTQPVDAEVASAYVRLWGAPKGEPFAGIALDPAPPNGHWTFPYAALSVHRRADWSVNIKGYSKYVWASEIYNLDNRYGRYQSSGVVQILPAMTQKEAGYVENGWDWNHPPGATTIERPFVELEPEEPLVMFKSEESYAGGCALDGDGVWAMKLNEADGFTIDPVKKAMSFPGNLKARKSVFCFGDRLLCLGSDIEADDPSAPVHTTLFQTAIRHADGAVSRDQEQRLLLDPVGNGYRILDDSKVSVTVGEQVSPNNKYSLRRGEGKRGTSPDASGLFATAWIDHGPAPKGGSYAYEIYPQVGDLERIENFAEPAVLRQDNAAHIVRDAESKITAYACFEGGELNAGLLESVSVPCYVMIREGDLLTLAVANPDLNQKEALGKGTFYGDSGEAPVTLRLKGSWKIKGEADAWTESAGEATLLTVKCREGKSMEVQLEPSDDRAAFEQLRSLEWTPVFSGSTSSDWIADGKFSSVKDTDAGMVFAAGPEEWNHAHHEVLWTKGSFAGDIRIDYDYTRLDDVNKWVNILYVLATGKGGEFAPDIMEWAEYRREPWMRNYFETMKLLHISYAAFGKEDLGADEDYVRCRRYPKADDGEFSKTEIKPDTFRTGLFRTGKSYHITAIKKGDRLFFHVAGDGKDRLFAWQSPLIGEVTEGRIGLRHMWMKSARYRNFTVSAPK